MTLLRIILFISITIFTYSATAEPFAYVGTFSNGTVNVIDTATNTVVDTITVGAGPLGVSISPDGDFVYISNFLDETLSVIKTETNQVVATVNIGNMPRGIAVSPNGDLIYVANTGDNNVSVINASTFEIITNIVAVKP